MPDYDADHTGPQFDASVTETNNLEVADLAALKNLSPAAAQVVLMVEVAWYRWADGNTVAADDELFIESSVAGYRPGDAGEGRWIAQIFFSGTTITFGDPAAPAVFAPGELDILQSITIKSPEATEDATLLFTNKQITITEMRAVVRGTTPSITWTVRHQAAAIGSGRADTGTEVVTSGTTTTSESSGSDVTSLTGDPTVPANAFLWLEITGRSGTVDEFHLSVIYDVD